MEARHSRSKMVLTLLGSLALVALGVWLVSSPDEFGDKGRLAGLCAVVVFGAFGTLSIVQLFDRRAILQITPDGIFDRRIVDRAIPWREVLGVSEITVKAGMNKHRYLYLDVGDPYDRFTSAALKRGLLNANQRFGRGVLINLNGLDLPPDQVRAAVLAGSQVTTTAPRGS